MSNFDDLGLAGTFLHVLDEVGYTSPTPIQAQSIPHLLEGRDLLGIAQTGTGKTAAFALPVLQHLSAGEKAPPKRPSALILAPTRELTVQIHTEFERLGQATSLRYGIVIGGVGENPQIRTLKQGVDVLAATPGRLLDLAANGHVDLSQVSILVLDEADRLLDMGFVRDVRRIVAQTPDDRQSLLFSATMPKEVRTLAADILKNPAKVDVSPKEMTVAKIEQRVIHVENAGKQRVLEALLREKVVERAIVFTRTKHGASRVAKKLVQAGIGADAIHGNKSQNARQRALQSFRDGEIWVLVATDIAARGLDIEGVTHVVNFELPHEPESYVHRIGRTGRAGASGLAWSLVDPEEVKRLKAIERLTRERITVWDSPAITETESTAADTDEAEQPARNQNRAQSGGRTDAPQNSGDKSSGDNRARKGRTRRKPDAEGGRGADGNTQNRSGTRQSSGRNRSGDGRSRNKTGRRQGGDNRGNSNAGGNFWNGGGNQPVLDDDIGNRAVQVRVDDHEIDDDIGNRAIEEVVEREIDDNLGNRAPSENSGSREIDDDLGNRATDDNFGNRAPDDDAGNRKTGPRAAGGAGTPGKRRSRKPRRPDQNAGQTGGNTAGSGQPRRRRRRSRPQNA